MAMGASTARIQDAAGGKPVLQCLFAQIKRSVHSRWCRLKLIWVDGGCGQLGEFVRQEIGGKLEIVCRPKDQKGSQTLLCRWLVERTFARLGRYRRLARDYEHTVASSEAMVYLASIRRMLKLMTN